MRLRAPETALPALSWSRMFFVIGGALLLSLTIEPALGILLPVSPAISLAVVGIIAAHNGALAGVVSGVVAGLVLDLIGGGALGVQLGSYALAGYAVGRAMRLVPAWHPLLRLAVVTPLLALQVPVAGLLARLAGSSFGFGPRTLLVFIVVQLATVLAITPLVAAVQPGPQRA